MRAGLNEVGWQEAQLAERRKCDPAKVKLAMRVRAETPPPLPAGRQMTLQWIAARRHMGTRTNLSNLLSQQRRKGKFVSICGTDGVPRWGRRALEPGERSCRCNGVPGGAGERQPCQKATFWQWKHFVC